MLAPPFVILSHIFMIIKYLVRLCQCKKIKFDRKLKAFLSDEMMQRLNDFEENCFYHYSCDLERSKNESSEEKINRTSKKVDNISGRIDDIFFKESMTKASLYKLELRLQKLEEMSYETVSRLSNLATNMRKNYTLNEPSHSQDSNVRLKLPQKTSDPSLIMSRLDKIRNFKRMRSNTISLDNDMKLNSSNRISCPNYDENEISGLRNRRRDKLDTQVQEERPVFQLSTNDLTTKKRKFIKFSTVTAI